MSDLGLDPVLPDVLLCSGLVLDLDPELHFRGGVLDTMIGLGCVYGCGSSSVSEGGDFCWCNARLRDFGVDPPPPLC